MLEVMLHPERDFLNPRNPSSPFQYKQQMIRCCWKYINENAVFVDGYYYLQIGEDYYFDITKWNLFYSIKHHFISW